MENSILWTNRLFGVEIEIYLPSLLLLKQELSKNNISFLHAPNRDKHKLYNCVKLIHDSSLKPKSGLEAIEINLPPSSDFKLLYQICNILKNVNAVAIDNCALHIHTDIRDKTWEQALDIMYYYLDNEQTILNNIQNIQHKTPCLTCSLSLANFTRKNEKCATHMKLSWPYRYYKTIEHRAFMGTIDYDEIVQCVLLTQDIVEKGLQYKKGRN